MDISGLVFFFVVEVLVLIGLCEGIFGKCLDFLFVYWVWVLFMFVLGFRVGVDNWEWDWWLIRGDKLVVICCIFVLGNIVGFVFVKILKK